MSVSYSSPSSHWPVSSWKTTCLLQTTIKSMIPNEKNFNLLQPITLQNCNWYTAPIIVQANYSTLSKTHPRSSLALDRYELEDELTKFECSSNLRMLCSFEASLVHFSTCRMLVYISAHCIKLSYLFSPSGSKSVPQQPEWADCFVTQSHCWCEHCLHKSSVFEH